jgi:hypothetical protein
VSLVSEALRKARQEAADRGTPAKGVVYRTTVMVGPRRSRSGAIALRAGATVLLVAAAALGWWAWQRHRTEPPPHRRTVAATAAPHTGAPAMLPRTGAERGTAGAASSTRAASAPTPAAAPPPSAAPGALWSATSTGSATRPADEIAPTPAAVPQRAAASVADRSTEASREQEDETGGHERSYLLTAERDGVKLTLDYIAYQKTKAFAGINGNEAVVGTIISGIRVDEIGPDYVRLHDRHGTFFLRTE